MERLFEMVSITELFHDSLFTMLHGGLSWRGLMLAERSLCTGPGSMVGRPVAEVVVVHVEEILLSRPGGRLRLRRFGMASFSLSGQSSESEQVCVSLSACRGLIRGRCSGCKLIWVLSRLLTARRELQVLGSREGSASRSEINPWASPITAMSTNTLVPDDCSRGMHGSEVLRWDLLLL